MTGALSPAWALLPAGLLGLLIGSFLNVVIWRVPRGESLLAPSHCPKCDAAVRPWQNIPVISYLALRGRCASCGTKISARYPLVEVGTALVFVLVTWWYLIHPTIASTHTTVFGIAWWLGLAGYLWFAAAGVALAVIDFEQQRLPNAIVLPSLAVVTAFLSAAAIVASDWPRLWATLGAAAALFVLFLAIALVYPKGIGGGDVKLAPLVGAALGYIGWDAVVVGAFVGFVCAALIGVVLMAVNRARWRSAIAFGPWMLVGAWVGLVWGPDIASAYISLVVPA